MTLFKRRQAVTPDIPAGEKLPRAEIGGGTHLREYEAIAQQAGFKNAALLEAQLRDFIAEQEIPVYQLTRVEEFLVAKMRSDPTVKRRERWCWAPLREMDMNRLHFADKRKNGYVARWQYQRAVPVAALKLVSKFVEKFGDRLNFYVSEYTSENADPFLGVMAAGVSMMVIAHWDEPGFTG